MHLRYHHLTELTDLSQSFNNWKSFGEASKLFSSSVLSLLNIENLHQMPEIGYPFIHDTAVMEGKAILVYAKGVNNGTDRDEFWHDYAGADAQYINQYVQEINIRYQHLLLSNPATVVNVVYNPDGFCESCQIKAHGRQVGSHCLAMYGSIEDYVWEKALEIVHDPRLVRLTIAPEYATQVGILRNLAETEVLDQAYDAAYTQVNKDLGRLLREGILIEDPVSGYTKVSPRYFGKEHY